MVVKGGTGRKGDTAASLDMPAAQVICRQWPEDLSGMAFSPYLQQHQEYLKLYFKYLRKENMQDNKTQNWIHR